MENRQIEPGLPLRAPGPIDLDDGMSVEIFEQSPQAAIACDADMALVYANAAAKKMFRLPDSHEHITLPRILPIRIRNRATTKSPIPNGLAADRRKNLDHRVERGRSLDGKPLVVNLAISSLCVRGAPVSLILCSKVKEAVEQAFIERENYQRLQTFVSFAPIGIFYLTGTLECDFVNDHWCQLTGLNIDESLGRGWLSAFVKDDIKSYIKEIQSGVFNKAKNEIECQIRTPLGKTRWVLVRSHVMQSAERSHLGIAGTVQDIDDLVKTKQSLQDLAERDYLTGLANRKLFMTTLKQSILRVARHNPLGLLFIDLNHFKEVNDRCGHNAGDEYLKICADRIRTTLREDDLVARLGGDEFTVLIEGVQDTQILSTIAEKILNNVSAPLVIDEQSFTPGAAIGIAVCNDSHMDASVFTKQADEAMYLAKQNDGKGYRFFSTQENAIASFRSAMSRNIGKALENHEIGLWYQAQYGVDDNKKIGSEALMRWRSPVLGNVSPSKFIAVLESSDLINTATHWVVEKVIHDLYQNQGHAVDKLGEQVSINISAKSIRDKQLIPRIKELLQEYPLREGVLACEITETVMLNDFDRASQFIKSLKNLGLKIALDDFGTGYCSLLYLRKFPIDCVKIDTSFIGGMIMQEEDRTIVKTIIDLGHNLNMKVIAEGVETESQLNMLKRFGCDYYQGFLTEMPPEYSLGHAAKRRES